MDVDDKEVMSALTQMVIDTFTREIAGKTRELSKTLPEGVSGRDALSIFADSIDGTNDKLFPHVSTRQ